MEGRRTALVLLAPEAEGAVDRFRQDLDPAAGSGVPAHLTVLFPFLPAPQVDDIVLRRLSDLFGPMPAFGYTLERSAWFGDEVLYLAPDADEEIRSLTRAAWAAFPGCPPYGGRFADVVPHLTVAERAPARRMAAAEREIGPTLPIHAEARTVTLLVERVCGRWAAVAAFALRGAPSASNV